jgi:hypothetical protein
MQTYRDLAALEAERPREAEADLVKGLRRTDDPSQLPRGRRLCDCAACAKTPCALL